ncbi:energy-coupling factor transporter transmembrane component T family protein [Haloferacaceae archaeon DSL9]
MIRYEPGSTVVHRLDPRSKLLFQVGFAAAAFGYATPRWLVGWTLLAVVALAAARVDPARTLWRYRFAAPFLVAAPLVSALRFGPPWIEPAAAAEPALASYRVLLVLLVSAAYIRTTPVRETRAAIQRTVPGKPGHLLGIGVALVFRFFPLLRRDLLAIRDAERARLGDERPLRERIVTVTVGGLNRAFERADRLSLALRARCLAWNPTLPPLRFSRLDAPVLGVGGLLLAAALVGQL